MSTQSVKETSSASDDIDSSPSPTNNEPTQVQTEPHLEENQAVSPSNPRNNQTPHVSNQTEGHPQETLESFIITLRPHYEAQPSKFTHRDLTDLLQRIRSRGFPDTDSNYEEDTVKAISKGLFPQPKDSRVSKYNKLVQRINARGGHLECNRNEKKLYNLVKLLTFLSPQKFDEFSLREGLIPTFAEIEIDEDRELSPLERYLNQERPDPRDESEETAVAKLLDSHITKSYKKTSKRRDLDQTIFNDNDISTTKYYYTRVAAAYLAKLNGRGTMRHLALLEMIPRFARWYRNEQRARFTFYYLSTLPDVIDLAGTEQLEDTIRRAYCAPIEKPRYNPKLTLLSDPLDAQRYICLEGEQAKNEFAVAIAHLSNNDQHIPLTLENWNLACTVIDDAIPVIKMDAALFKRRISSCIRQFSERAKIDVFCGSNYEYSAKRRIESLNELEPKKKKTPRNKPKTRSTTSKKNTLIPRHIDPEEFETSSESEMSDGESSTASSIALVISDHE